MTLVAEAMLLAGAANRSSVIDRRRADLDHPLHAEMMAVVQGSDALGHLYARLGAWFAAPSVVKGLHVAARLVHDTATVEQLLVAFPPRVLQVRLQLGRRQKERPQITHPWLTIGYHCEFYEKCMLKAGKTK